MSDDGVTAHIVPLSLLGASNYRNQDGSECPTKVMIALEDHDRIVAELKARMSDSAVCHALDAQTIASQSQEIAELKNEIELRAKPTVKRLRETIATQKRVIEKLREQRCVNVDTQFRAMRAGFDAVCMEGIIAFQDAEIEAIERGEK